MRHRLFLSVLTVCCVASARQAPQKPDTPPLSKADKHTIAQITKLQQRIDRLDSEIATHQAKIKALTHSLSVPGQATIPLLDPKVARVLNTQGHQDVIINAGRKGDGIRRSDQLLFARRVKGGLVLAGRGVVTEVYPTDTVCSVTEGVGYVSPEDEVYVANRRGSPYSIARIQLTPEEK